MNLVIIEGPGKLLKISHILGENYKVVATVGHIEKLKNTGFDKTGISKELDFDWELEENKKEIVERINKLGANSEAIFVATDPDREGEGIAWHIYNNLNKNLLAKTKRITFNEISENAIQKALKNPRELDNNWINSYLTRKVLDKKYGYGLSRFLQQKENLKSAGRVQSPALKIIYDNYLKRKEFDSKTYYKISPKIKNCVFNQVESKLDKELNFEFDSLENIKDFINKNFQSNEFKVYDIKKNRKLVAARKPYTTSDLLSLLSSELKIKSDVASATLQTLYNEGLISYPRTDSKRFNDEFCNESLNYVKNLFPGLEDDSFSFNKNASGAQDAHEAIRVIDLALSPEIVDNNHDDKLLVNAYEIIYTNTIIQFFQKQEIELIDVFVENGTEKFKYSYSVEIRKGWNSYINKEFKDTYNFELNKVYSAENFENMEHKIITKPPELFTQASLISKLEILGIGRPSTFASISSKNLDRNYLSLDEKDKLIINESGIKAIEALNKEFDTFIDYDFTKKMEDDLDLIKNGDLNWKSFLLEKIANFENHLYSIVSLKNNYPKFGTCPNCGADTHQIKTKKGDLVELCSKRDYNPETKINSGCDFVKFESTITSEIVLDEKCPKCSGNIIKITTKDNKVFRKCENRKYDSKTQTNSGCDFVKFENTATSEIVLDEKCPKCSGNIIKITTKNKKSFKKCENGKYDSKTQTNSGCDYVEFPDLKDKKFKKISKFAKKMSKKTN